MKLISELILRISLVALVAPVIPVADQVNSLFRHVTYQLEQVQYLR